jgi:hypothetical protein
MAIKIIGGLLILLSAGCGLNQPHAGKIHSICVGQDEKGQEIWKDASQIGQDEKEKTFICVGEDEKGKMIWVADLEIKQYEKEHRVTREEAVENFCKEMHLARTPDLGEEKIKVEFDFDINDFSWAKESNVRIVEIKGDSSLEQPVQKSSSSNQEGPSR